MVIVVIYACAITCGRSFTVLSVWGVLISVWSVLVFSPTLLSLFNIITLLILLLVFVVTIIGYYCKLLFISTELLALVMGAWAGAGYGGQGSWLGCR